MTCWLSFAPFVVDFGIWVCVCCEARGIRTQKILGHYLTVIPAYKAIKKYPTDANHHYKGYTP